MKKLLLDLLVKIDKKKEYDYETAPYCGHYYDGWNGILTDGDFCEGMGGYHTKWEWLRLSYCTERDRTIIYSPRFDRFRVWWYNLKIILGNKHVIILTKKKTHVWKFTK